MSFAVFVDGSANLPRSMLEGIQLLPCEYTVDGVPQTYWGDVDSFDGHSFYEDLKKGKVVRTSLLNTQLFLSRFGPILASGTDIIYISMSSGISGTYKNCTREGLFTSSTPWAAASATGCWPSARRS